MANYYLDGTTLDNSTSVFTDAELTICAADGFYSDGTIVRELSGCSLLPAQICPSCLPPAEPCGGSLSASGNQGIYLLNIDTGGTAFDVGAIIVKFNPFSVPDGIKAIYDGVVYNKLSAYASGYHGSTNASGHTYVGTTGSDCGISGNTYVLNEYVYSDGSFNTSGNQQTVSIDSGDVSLTSSSPGTCTMVIPKPTPAPTQVSFEFVGPCSGTAFDIEVFCPALLFGYQSSNISEVNSTDACARDLIITYYNVPVRGSEGVPGLYDFVFSDQYGQNKLPGGFYKTSSGWIEVDFNGVVIDTGSC